MTRLRNLEISRLEREVVRLVTKLGWTEPLPLYRPAYSTRHFAYEDFINSLLVILGTTEGIETLQERAGGDSKTIRKREKGVDLQNLLPVLDTEDVARTDSTRSRETSS